jgi:hypothetical protein
MQEADWKVMRKLIPGLRERYLRRRNEEFIALLSASGKTETERFWDTDDAIRREAKVLRDCLDDLRRSRLFEILLLMRHHGMFLDEDLAQFSDDAQKELRGWGQK